MKPTLYLAHHAYNYLRQKGNVIASVYPGACPFVRKQN